MNNLQKRNSVVAAAAIIVSITIYNWFVTPHTEYLRAEQNYQNAISAVEKKNRIIDNELTAINRKLETLNNDYDRRKQMFFDIAGAKDFLVGIQTAAEQNGCAIENIKFIPAREVKTESESIDITQYQTGLNVTGDYGSILKFLNTIQNRPQKVQFDSLDIEINSQTGSLDCGLNMSIYTLKVKECVKNVSQK